MGSALRARRCRAGPFCTFVFLCCCSLLVSQHVARSGAFSWSCWRERAGTKTASTGAFSLAPVHRPLDRNSVIAVAAQAEGEAVSLEGAEKRSLLVELGLENMTKYETERAARWMMIDWNIDEWFRMGEEMGAEGRERFSEALMFSCEETDACRPEGLSDSEWATMIRQIGDPELPRAEWIRLGDFLGDVGRRRMAKVEGMLRMYDLRGDDEDE